MRYLLAIALTVLAFPAFAQNITLVQQYQSWIDYDTEYLEYHPCTQCYTAYHLQRATKNLAKAIAACNAGACLPPLLNESGVAQLQAPYVGTRGQGGTTPSGGADRGTNSDPGGVADPAPSD